MNKETKNTTRLERPLGRFTRARAKALSETSGVIVQPPKPGLDQKRVLRAKYKRAEAADENRASGDPPAGFQNKRRSVLKDVTNVECGSLNVSKIWTTARDPPKKGANIAKSTGEKIPIVDEDPKAKLAEELSKIKVAESEELKIYEQLPHYRQYGLRGSVKKEEVMICEKPEASKDLDIVDIDSNLKDPQACSLYARDIHNNIRITELERRPSSSYMEESQSDISPNMRAILIDWLVEVSEEYNLVPDTLYLTVNLIDRFLSHNHIEKQRLQLVGVVCMLISSKYEEICAPRAEEFCVITDSTYTRGEVLRMESEILNFLHFHLSVPTTKTFLRRFIHAAQCSYEAPSVELEFLANYLAELTLVDYNFLKFLPSLVAASAVFLARWTLRQLENPWNVTLEHYTGYKASELKKTVLAMADLHINNNGYTRNAIRDKYRQQKFKCVANLGPTQPIESLFQ